MFVYMSLQREQVIVLEADAQLRFLCAELERKCCIRRPRAFAAFSLLLSLKLRDVFEGKLSNQRRQFQLFRVQIQCELRIRQWTVRGLLVRFTNDR